jgi:hypothetical protein
MKKFLASAALALGVLTAGAASATVYTLGATVNNNGNTVSASADVVQSGSTLTIDLTNTTTNLFAANQLLTGLTIFFDNDPTGVTLTSQSGQLVNINSDGSTTNVAGAPTSWSAALTSGNVYVTTIGGGAPVNGIISNSISSTPNGGLVFDSTFDPYILGTGHFVANLTGGSSISGVTFNFGTMTGEFTSGCVGRTCGGGGGQGVPEPASWAMMIIGFTGVGALVRRRRYAFA